MLRCCEGASGAMLRRFLLQISDALLLSLIFGSWQYLTKTPLNVRTALALAGFYLILRTLDALRKFDECDTATAITPQTKNKRVFVDNPEAVPNLARLAGLAYIRRSTPYLGKWTVMSGSYEGMAKSLQGESIHLSILLNDGQRVNLRFGADRGDQLRRLRVGQGISAVGQIPMFGSTFLPENCELVRAELPTRGSGCPEFAYMS
jgi:hypothetical protein